MSSIDKKKFIPVQNNETNPGHEIKITPNANENEDELKAHEMKYGFIGIC